jgi:hypothetical protein
LATNGDKLTNEKTMNIVHCLSMQDDTIEMFSPAELSECESLPSDVKNRIISDETAGRYTAQNLKRKKPQVYQACAAMIGSGLPFTYIAEVLGIHFYSVEAIAQAEPDYINKCKERVSKMGFAITQRTLEKISDNLEHMSLNKTDDFYKATLIATKVAETSNLLSGGVTERVAVEQHKQYSSAEEFERDIWKEGAIDV